MCGPMLVPIVVAILAAYVPASAQTAPTPQPTAPASQPAPETPWPPDGVVRPGRGVALPRLVTETKPHYTADAMREKIHGRVWMEAVVRADGTVGEVRVTRSLDRTFGLDDRAVESLKTWRFTPGSNDGVPVAVLVVVEMSFMLGK